MRNILYFKINIAKGTHMHFPTNALSLSLSRALLFLSSPFTFYSSGPATLLTNNTLYSILVYFIQETLAGCGQSTARANDQKRTYRVLPRSQRRRNATQDSGNYSGMQHTLSLTLSFGIFMRIAHHFCCQPHIVYICTVLASIKISIGITNSVLHC